jgi:hypothetical protein
MNKKIMVMLFSVLAVFFLAAQTCSLDSSLLAVNELALGCEEIRDIVCDGTKAYECDTVNGLTYTLYRESGYDTEYCATGEIEGIEETEVVTEETLEGDPLPEETCVECTHVAAKISTLANSARDILVTAQTSRTNIQESGVVMGDGTLSTKTMMLIYKKAKLLDGALVTTATDLSDLAADLAALMADHPIEAIEIEAGVFASAETNIMAAQEVVTNLVTDLDKEFTARWVPVEVYEILSISLVSGTPASDIHVWSYNSGMLLNYLAEMDVQSGSIYGAPYLPSEMMVGASIASQYGVSTWAGYTGEEVIELEYYDGASVVHTTKVYLPMIDSNNLGIPGGNEHMPLYVAADGSTFWVDKAGIPYHGINGLNPPIFEVSNLARAAG